MIPKFIPVNGGGGEWYLFLLPFLFRICRFHGFYLLCVLLHMQSPSRLPIVVLFSWWRESETKCKVAVGTIFDCSHYSCQSYRNRFMFSEPPRKSLDKVVQEPWCPKIIGICLLQWGKSGMQTFSTVLWVHFRDFQGLTSASLKGYCFQKLHDRRLFASHSLIWKEERVQFGADITEIYLIYICTRGPYLLFPTPVSVKHDLACLL